MRKILIFLVSLIFINFLFAKSAFAHLAGQPPYLRINGQYTSLYPIPVSSASNFALPQDIAVGNFLVGQNLMFVLEEGKLPAPPEVVRMTKFVWDFGDGSDKQNGLQASHTYSKMGSYVQSISADDGNNGPQLLSSVLINVVPNETYKLPQSAIYVNKITSSNPLVEPLKFDLTKTLSFDGSKSVGGDSKIISYLWDMGDGQTKSQVAFGYSYTSQTNQIFPVLRVKDENGFISDSFVELSTGNPSENTPLARAANKANSPSFLSQASNVMLGIGILTGSLLIGILIFKKRKRKK